MQRVYLSGPAAKQTNFRATLPHNTVSAADPVLFGTNMCTALSVSQRLKAGESVGKILSYRKLDAGRLSAPQPQRLCAARAADDRRSRRRSRDGSGTTTTTTTPPPRPTPSPQPPTNAGSSPIPSFSSQGGPGQWRVNQWPVAEVLGKNFLFFEAQESGKLRDGHRIPWRGDSFMQDGVTGRNLDGGWFDAGDHLKLIYPMCWAVTHMAWSMAEGKRLLKETSFDGQSNWDAAVRNHAHALDFLFRCHLNLGEFVCQIGEKEHDHANAFRAEQDFTTPRTVFTTASRRPGADILFQAAAAFAASAVALRGEGDEGSRRNAQKAEDYAHALYNDARGQMPSIYSNSNPECAKTYKSDNWEHTAFWASAWMYRMTRKDFYRQEAKQFQFGAGSRETWYAHNWSQVYFGACLLLWEDEGMPQNASDDRWGYENNLRSFAEAHLNVHLGVRRTPQGLTYIDQWGTLRHACGCAWVMAGFARGLRRQGRDSKLADDLMWLSERQVTYAMGAAGRSYICGFGNNPPQQPHHRNAALAANQNNQWSVFENTSRPNAHVITGALVGGPDLQDRYNDKRNNFEQNEVAVDYNAALMAGLVQTAMSYTGI